jgi:hypothetical protein
VSWDPTTVDCKFIKDEIARLAREKMAELAAEGCISSIHFCKKRATDFSDLHGWKSTDRFVKVNPSISR